VNSTDRGSEAEKPTVNILLVEDDEDDYILVRKLLSQIASLKYELKWAPTYDAALEAIGNDHHDVCLIDYHLGDRTGLDLMQETKGKTSACPMIFLTGHEDHDVEAMRAGASDYLVKGRISADLLERSIRYAIERKRLEAQLVQSQKMEALGTLAGGIAHDFNNILAAIIGFGELLRDHAPQESRERRHAQRVLDAGLRGRELVRQMLTFSRQAELEKKPMGLSMIVKESAALLRAFIPSTVTINVNVKSESGVILGDPTQISQVLMNLATNAAHAMREKGGALDIELSDFSVSPSNGNPLGIEPGLYMKLTVRDTGAGIPPEIIDRIFDPFFTTKEVGEGTGLGLSVVLGIVKQSRGYITVESEPGKGSTFDVYFPKIVEEPAPALSKETIPLGNERILFVDDEEVLVEMGEELLAELGYEVTCRTSSGEALALLKEDPLRFDLVITDVTMPEMTGVDLAREALAIRPDLPIIMCTGYSHLVNADAAEAAGIRAFVMKPLTKRDIARIIRQVLG
jgi:signal transduction histidine kinase